MISSSLGGAQSNIFPANSTLRPAHMSPRGEARMHFSVGLECHTVSKAVDAPMSCRVLSTGRGVGLPKTECLCPFKIHVKS